MPPSAFQFKARSILPVSAALPLLLAGCARHAPAVWQGYLEGEFVYVASPLSGQLETLTVAKGARVETRAPLFSLEHAAETAAQRQAAEQLASAQARVADLRKGLRPTEIKALEARLDQARATAQLAQLDLKRQEALFHDHAISASEFDRARLTHEANRRAVEEIAAQLGTARLGGRADVVAAAESDVRAAADALARADWSVAQKAQSAPCAALVYDTLYRQGEFVAAGSPVVALLPPANLKVRFFVGEGDYGRLAAGARVSVSLSGRDAPIGARVSYLSPQPEYTPPVLYNRDNRAKLVYMIEAVFDPADARDLHPGQPADVSIPAG